MHDPYFKRSVVLLTEHNANGSVGFILNKPVDLKIQNAIMDFPEYKDCLYLGGPVQKDQLFFVHTCGEKIPDSVPISHGLYWGGDFEVVKDLIRANAIDPKQLRFFAGYAGWEPNQLDEELNQRAWIVAHMKKDHVIGENSSQLWRTVLKSMGKEYAVLANFPEDPMLN